MSLKDIRNTTRIFISLLSSEQVEVKKIDLLVDQGQFHIMMWGKKTSAKSKITLLPQNSGTEPGVGLGIPIQEPLRFTAV